MDNRIVRAAATIERGPLPGSFDYFRPITRFIVFRPAPDAPAGFMPPRLDGWWINRPTQLGATFGGLPANVGITGTATATGRYERRDGDGMVAEVYEVAP